MRATVRLVFENDEELVLNLPDMSKYTADAWDWMIAHPKLSVVGMEVLKIYAEGEIGWSVFSQPPAMAWLRSRFLVQLGRWVARLRGIAVTIGFIVR